MEFIRSLGIELLGEREDLRAGLGKYAEYRLAGGRTVGTRRRGT
jgi:hypothetical protein